MSLPKDDDINKTITGSDIKPPDLDFIDKKEEVTDIGKNDDMPMKSKNEDVNADVQPEILEEIKGKTLDEREDEILVAAKFPFKIKKKDTLKNEPYGKDKKERIDKQKEIINKIDENKDLEIDQGSGQIILKEFSDEEVGNVNDILKKFGVGELKEQKKNQSLKTIFKDLDVDENGMYKPGSFADVVNTIFQDQLIKGKGGVTKVDDILAQAAELGRTDVYLKILRSKPGDNLPLDVSVRAMIETKLLYMHLKKIAQKALDEGSANKQTQVEFYKVLTLFGQMYAKTAGDLSGAAKKMRITQEITKVQPDLGVSLSGVENIARYLEDNMNADFSEDGFNNLAKHFLMLDTHQATKFAKDAVSTKLANGWVEIWVNSRLMSPITHIVNVVGNLGFNSLRVMEYSMAAAINKVPFFSSPDGVMFNEVLAMIRSTNYGLKLGMDNAAEGFKSGAAITKLDLPNRKSITKDVLQEKYKNSYMGTMLEYFGTAVRFPGRMLVAEDEFFKGVLFQMELERLATKRFNKALSDGATKEQAEDLYLRTIADPPTSVRDEVLQSMKEGTFQQDLPPGFFKNIQGFMNEPAVKLFVPFYKTVTNIFFESSKRNPMLAGLMPSVRRDLMGVNGPAKKQLAMAKLMSGATIMYGMFQYAYGASDGSGDYIITGRAPGNKAEREAFFRNGYQPYSIGIRQDDGNFKFYTYSRFDPISSLLAISADIAYAASRPDQYGNSNHIDEMMELMMHGVSAIFPYMGEQPFLTGISEIGRIFNSPGSDTDNKIINGFGLAIQKVTEGTVGIALNPTGTFGNYLERMQDPNIYDYKINDQQAEFWRNTFDGDIPYPIRSFYEAYNKILKGSPFFNPELEPRLNLWGEQMKGPEQGVFSPVNILNQKGYKRVDDWLQTYGLGLSMPRNKIDGIAMTSQQYNALIMFMNEDNDGDGISDMLQEMDAEFDSLEWDTLSVGSQLGELRAVKTKYFEIGKNKLYSLYPELKNSVDNLKEKIDKTGKR